MAGPSGYSPYEILLGKPTSLIRAFKETIRELGESNLTDELQVLGKAFSYIHKAVLEKIPIISGSPAHFFLPGDSV